MKSTMLRLAASLALVPSRLDSAVRGAASRCFTRARQLDARRTAVFALAALAMTALADPAFAQAGGGQGDITTFFQNAVNIITGKAGKLIAVLAICVVGIGAMMGALSMRAAGGVILGVMLVFSSAWIVNQIIGQ
ncbi:MULTISPECIES: TrbC/VirB2 family protein [Hyphomicrobiales]|jgi:type IV secretory pathway VirB2 component (pilin)|uniref:Type IV secretion family protein VIRB2 n=1 Tax=Methylorubrum populi TaxID=223967 RepID=A0A169RKV4_9HYPH|nr:MULTISPECIES: TrbC/VirB2 family protein [Hyphomicrobiales]MDH0699714.1 TrbC/VirB2 family protein [Agrobacterium sp. GD03871]MDH1062575.1 TrbC/VirB2 family protein [Agrobacterium sp. GD03992]MDH2228066.1 TrbC/VirB2 family protein [Agrobacterium sp. GD03642]BAU94192.1 type IV secretion family protein VIRB2 [Methylorubrum populi]